MFSYLNVFLSGNNKKGRTGSSNGGVKTCVAAARPYLCSVSANGQFARSIFEQKKNYIFSIFRRIYFLARNKKKTKPYSSPTHQDKRQEDEIMTALGMTQDVGATLQAILDKLEKLDSMESAVKKIEANLKKLENRTRRLEDFQTTAKKDIEYLKEGINFTGQQLSDKTEALERTHRLYETQLAELMRKCQKNEDLLGEIHAKNLYLESYSRRENIKLTNIEESTEIDGRNEGTEEVLRNFLERDFGYREATNVAFQRDCALHRKKHGWKSASYSGPFP